MLKHPIRGPHLPALSRQRGGTFLGIVIGLVIGLAIAVVVALYITNSQTPFVAKMPPRNGDSAIAPGDTMPDPNKPLQSKVPVKPVGNVGDAISADKKAEEADPTADRKRDGQAGEDPLADLARAIGMKEGGREGTREVKEAKEPKDSRETKEPREAKTSREGTKEAPKETAKEGEAEKVSYILQVGAYKTREDADQQKAMLAMQGMESRISEREANGTKFYRVRIGPYAQAEDMTRARERLQALGVEASVIRQQR